MTISVKIVNGSEVRRVSVTSFENLVATILNVYGLEASSVFFLKYQDDDGDEITVSSDMELEEAARCVAPKALKMYIFFDHESSIPAQPRPVVTTQPVQQQQQQQQQPVLSLNESFESKQPSFQSAPLSGAAPPSVGLGFVKASGLTYTRKGSGGSPYITPGSNIGPSYVQSRLDGVAQQIRGEHNPSYVRPSQSQSSYAVASGRQSGYLSAQRSQKGDYQQGVHDHPYSQSRPVHSDEYASVRGGRGTYVITSGEKHEEQGQSMESMTKLLRQLSQGAASGQIGAEEKAEMKQLLFQASNPKDLHSAAHKINSLLQQ